ncbi:MAG TPA: tetratricopeptide repeat protein [Terriglobia bacterium]|nr:tetratricopeptide repeat protein [Terriglobia bacterium]
MSKRNPDASVCLVRSLLPLFLLPLCCLLFLPTGGFAQEGLKLSYEKAQQLFERGENADAAAAFRTLLAQTYQARAALYQQEGLWKEAGDDLKAALDLNPRLKAIRYDLAYTDFRLRHYDEAASSLERLAGASPDDSRVHALLGKTYFSLGKTEAARRELQLALRLNPTDHLTAYTLALADLTGKDPVGADQIFAQLEKGLGSSARFHLVVARAYSDTGYQEPARRELGRALAIDPKTRYAHYLLAIALLRESGTGALAQAQKELAQESRLFPDEYEAQYLLGVLLAFQRRWDDAGRALRNAVQLAPQQSETYFYLGNVYLNQGLPRQAAGAFRNGLDLAKSQGGTGFPLDRAHLLLSRAYRALGEREASAQQAKEAGSLFRARSSKGSEDADVNARLRESLAGLSSPVSTVTWKDPSAPVPLTARQKQFLKVYGQVLVSGHNYLARIAVSEGKFGEAARQFAQIRNLQPDYPEVDFRLGLALFKAEQFPQALDPLKKAVARNPADPLAARYLGLTCFELGRYTEAARLLRQARDSSPNDPEILLALGGALARLHRDQEAQNVFGELLKSNPNSAAVHILLGKAYAAQGQAPQAEQEFRHALELDPQAPSAHLYLGILKLQNGQLAEAGTEFKAELLAHPGALEARYNLAFVLLKQQKVAEAIPLLRQVIQEKPGYGEAHYSLGKALLQQGETREAIDELKKAVQLDPQKAYAHYQLGRAYLLAGQRKEAQQEFELTRNLKDQQLKFQGPQPGQNP